MSGTSRWSAPGERWEQGGVGGEHKCQVSQGTNTTHSGMGWCLGRRGPQSISAQSNRPAPKGGRTYRQRGCLSRHWPGAVEGTLAWTSGDPGLSLSSGINALGGWLGKSLSLFEPQVLLCSMTMLAWVRDSQSWLLSPEEHWKKKWRMDVHFCLEWTSL